MNIVWVVLAAAVIAAALLTVRSKGDGPVPRDPRDAGRLLRERLRFSARAAFDPVVAAEDTEIPASKFGGRPWLPEGSAWPVCAGCAEPLSFFVQLDLASLPQEAGVQGAGLLQLFLCTNPDSRSEVCHRTWQHGSQAVVLRIVDSRGPGSNAAEPAPGVAWPPKRVTGWKPLVDYPGYEDVERAGLELSEDFMALWEAAEDQDRVPECHQDDKLGGWPFWAQSPEFGTCRVCGARMELVLQIDSHDNVPFMFGDGGLGHVCQCRAHPTELSWGWAGY